MNARVPVGCRVDVAESVSPVMADTALVGIGAVAEVGFPALG